MLAGLVFVGPSFAQNTPTADVLGLHHWPGPHPFSLVMPTKDARTRPTAFGSDAKAADPTGAVTLITRSVESTTGDAPHLEKIHKSTHNFLARARSGTQKSVACRDTNWVV